MALRRPPYPREACWAGVACPCLARVSSARRADGPPARDMTAWETPECSRPPSSFALDEVRLAPNLAGGTSVDQFAPTSDIRDAAGRQFDLNLPEQCVVVCDSP